MLRGLAYAMRGVILLTLVLFSILGMWGAVLLHATAFIVTLPLLWLGKRDAQYYTLDTAIMTIFLASVLFTLFSWWPENHTLYSQDKLLHAAGGAWLATLAYVSLRQRITDRLALCIATVSFAAAVGAFWEVFEWVLTLLPEPLLHPGSGLADSMMDIIADTAGAIAAAVVLFRR